MERNDKIIITLLARIAGALEGKPYEEILKEVIDNTARKNSAPMPQADADIVERIYKLYPTTTETKEGKRSTGKSAKDRTRIRALLKTHMPEQIESVINKYVEEQGGKYLKNFSTFLNNFPECGDTEKEPAPVQQITAQFTRRPDGFDEYIRERQAFYDNL